MAKKTKQTRKHQLPFTVLIILVGVVSLVVIGLLTQYSLSRHTVSDRKDRIVAIYDSIKLDDSYIIQGSDIFGEKRVYDWDKGRSFSSSKTYVRGTNVDETVADLKQKITAAGFSLFDEPYGGGQQHFKSDKNEYVRVSVSSKLRDDAFQNALLMKQSTDDAANMDMNAGPSSVIIKVNLDDNNE